MRLRKFTGARAVSRSRPHACPTAPPMDVIDTRHCPSRLIALASKQCLSILPLLPLFLFSSSSSILRLSPFHSLSPYHSLSLQTQRVASEIAPSSHLWAAPSPTPVTDQSHVTGCCCSLYNFTSWAAQLLAVFYRHLVISVTFRTSSCRSHTLFLPLLCSLASVASSSSVLRNST